jgi:hypothetical protein
MSAARTGRHAAQSDPPAHRAAGPGQVVRNPARARYRMVLTSALVAAVAAVVAVKSSRLRRVVFAAFAVSAAGERMDRARRHGIHRSRSPGRATVTERTLSTG